MPLSLSHLNLMGQILNMFTNEFFRELKLLFLVTTFTVVLVRGVETKWHGLGDIARGTEMFLMGLEVILFIRRLARGHLKRLYLLRTHSTPRHPVKLKIRERDNDFERVGGGYSIGRVLHSV